MLVSLAGCHVTCNTRLARAGTSKEVSLGEAAVALVSLTGAAPAPAPAPIRDESCSSGHAIDTTVPVMISVSLLDIVCSVVVVGVSIAKHDSAAAKVKAAEGTLFWMLTTRAFLPGLIMRSERKARVPGRTPPKSSVAFG